MGEGESKQEFSAIGKCDKVSDGDKDKMLIKYFNGPGCFGTEIDSPPADSSYAPLGSRPPAKGTAFKTGNTYTMCSDTMLLENVEPGPTPPASKAMPKNGGDSTSATGLSASAMVAAAVVATLY